MVIRRVKTEDIYDLHELYEKHLSKEVLDISEWTFFLTKITANPDYHLLVCDNEKTAFLKRL